MPSANICKTNIISNLHLAMQLYWLNKLKENKMITDNEYFNMKISIINKIKS